MTIEAAAEIADAIQAVAESESKNENSYPRVIALAEKLRRLVPGVPAPIDTTKAGLLALHDDSE